MNLSRRTLFAGAVALAAFAFAPAQAAEIHAGDLVITNPWSRATAPGAPVAGGFMVIANHGGEPDRLVGGAAGFAGKVEIHEMKMEGDVMKMRPLADGLEIPAGGEVTLKPGSFHVMFMQLHEPLVEGEPQKAVLHFEKAGDVEVEFAVGGLGAGMAPGMSGMSGMDMPKPAN